MASYSRNTASGPHAPKITFADVLYALFRHKWKIAIILGLGGILATIVPRYTPLTYQSEAKLFVKYVVENKSPGQVGSGSTTTSDESVNAINTEMEILTSLDLAQQVADTMGAAKILAKAGGGTNRYAAAGFIHGNLVPDAAKGSKVIRVSFRHPDPEMAQLILDQVIQAYLTRHEEVHRHVGVFDDFLTQQTEQLKSRLTDTEAELRHAKTSAGIISLDDSKRAYTEQIVSIKEKITEAEADLAERKAMAEQMAKVMHLDSPTLTPQPDASPVSPETVTEYEQVCSLLETQRKKLQDLLTMFTRENSWVKAAQAQVDTTVERKRKLEASNPGLAALRLAQTAGTGPDSSAGMRATLMTEAARAIALQSKIAVFTEQLARIRKEAGTIDQAEASITELQRTRELQEKNYQYFKQNLEQSKFDQALGANRAYNISIIQAPSPSFGVSQAPKIKEAIVLGSIAAAFGLAFLVEFVLDKSIKRPADVTGKLGFPLFLSIPRLGLRHKLALKRNRRLVLAAKNGSEPKPAAPAAGETLPETSNHTKESQDDTPDIVPWGPRHILRPFCEALGDRLITFFDVNNLTHKPKLVAVTSCSSGAGVSTVATGLAASLSETGDGNVLLVAMDEKDGVVQQFYKGDPACGLDNVLEKTNRSNALVRDNLYMVAESTDSEHVPIPLPKRFKHLVPKLRASDYDYIIFDMPSVTQVSTTARLVRFMDFVVVVVESGKTDPDDLKQAYALLAESKTNVGVVLNKQKAYAPKWLRH